MKRKILSLALITALVFALSVSAFATDSGSPSGEDVLPDVSAEVGTITEVSEAVEAEAAGRADITSSYYGFAALYGTDWKNIKSIDVQVVFNFTPASPDKVAVGQKVTFTNVPGVSAGQPVMVFHKVGDGGTAAQNWERLDAVATANGTVVVTFNGSASPIAIVTATLWNAVPTNPGTSTSVVTSPQTSDIG